MKKITCIAIGVLALLSACSEEEETEAQEEQSTVDVFTLTSVAVEEGNLLEAYKCEEKVNGVENSIPLSWTNVPEAANSLAVVMHHYPDVSNLDEVNAYLLLWDINTAIDEIPYGTADEGSWFMGSNKDGNAISYTSPCSQGTGVHEYTITLYALAETPPSLPTASSIDVDYATMISALTTVTVVDKAVLTFNDVN